MLKKLLPVLLFFILYAFRWESIKNPLPSYWKANSTVRVSLTLLNVPEYTDTSTIVRSGIWYMSIDGYVPVIPGDRFEFVGIVEPKMVGTKMTRIKMINPQMKFLRREEGCIACLLHSSLTQLREGWSSVIARSLPEPMASLSIGILLGIKTQMPSEFYQALVSTGTMHVIAASGYNVAIVANALIFVMSKFLSKSTSIFFAVLGIFVYVLMSGASSSVIRAGIMGSLTLISYFFGRPAEAKRIFFVTLMIMLIMNPLALFDIGLQLSAGATFGLLYFSTFVTKIGERITKYLRFQSSIRGFLAEYLYPTLAATLFTLPIIWWYFGRVSWISPIVNIFVLPFVPIIMLITVLIILFGYANQSLGQLIGYFDYVPLAWIVWIIRIFGQIG